MAEAARLREEEMSKNGLVGDATGEGGDGALAGSNISQFHRNAVVTINEEGVIQEVNAGAFKLFGYDQRTDLLQRNVSVLMTFPYRSLHDEFLDRYRTTGVKKVIGIRQTLFGLHRNGHAFPLQLHVVEMKGKKRLFAGLVTPVTEKESNGVILINQQGIIQMVNKKTCQLFGYRPQELVGSNVTVLMPAEYAAQHDGFLQRYLATGVSKVIGTSGRNVSARSKTGKLIPISLEVTEENVDGTSYFLGSILDMQTLVAEAYMDGNGIIKNVNDAFLFMFGYERASIVGQNVKCLMPEPYRTFHDGYLERYRRLRVSTILKATEGRNLPASHRDGSVFTVNLKVKKLEEGYNGEMMFHATIQRLEETDQAIMAVRQKVSFSLNLFYLG
jgi:PAS domain S-box-containing protein